MKRVIKQCAVYAALAALGGLMIATMTVVFGSGSGSATASQIDAYVRAQPDDCRAVAQVLLERRMAERGRPLSVSDVGPSGVMRDIDARRCQEMAEQLAALGGRTS